MGRKAGRPARHEGERLAKNRTFRVRGRLDKMLQKAAGKAGRSVSEEIEFRLERSFYDDRMSAELLGGEGGELLRMIRAAMVLGGIDEGPGRAETVRTAVNAIIAAAKGLPLELPAAEGRREGHRFAADLLLAARQPLPPELERSG